MEYITKAILVLILLVKGLQISPLFTKEDEECT